MCTCSCMCPLHTCAHHISAQHVGVFHPTSLKQFVWLLNRQLWLALMRVGKHLTLPTYPHTQGGKGWRCSELTTHCSAPQCRPGVNPYLIKRWALSIFSLHFSSVNLHQREGHLWWDGLIDAITLKLKCQIKGCKLTEKERMWRLVLLLWWKQGQSAERIVNIQWNQTERRGDFWLWFISSLPLGKCEGGRQGENWWACQLVMGEMSQGGRWRTEGGKMEGGVCSRQ